MTPENFCYWLKGWFELNSTIDHRYGATKETMEMIEKHLGYVFNPPIKVPPSGPYSPRISGGGIGGLADGGALVGKISGDIAIC